ncbi:interleukin-1 receptor type 2 isoform X2 [Monodelphis domestica]|uniref:interleukin-1 receptor type 2 isoform X2 n=1 Tax=Monodelphis domestica TaxID=13616 RepID=UPI00044349DF|nr:interleukin-1 receptor type 2 isoform X2 [Monodelphis domestica]
MQNHRPLDTGPQISVSCFQKRYGLFFFLYALVVNVSASSIQLQESTENCQDFGDNFIRFVVEGEPVVLKAPFLRDFFSLPYKLSWHKNDSEKTVLGVGESGRTWIKDNALWIVPASVEDTGTYICTIRNESYCATKSIELKVLKKMTASLHLISYRQTVVSSSPGRLVCPEINDFIQKTNKMEIKWYKDSVLLDESNKKFSILKGSTDCHINNVSLNNSGYYTCELPFVHGNVKYNITRHIKLRVLKKKEDSFPVIILPNKTISTSLGSKLIIPCKAFFGLGPQSTMLLWWTANKTFVDNVYKEGRVKEGQHHKYLENNKSYLEAPLIFDSVEKKDLYTEFVCTARNRLGSQTLHARVKEGYMFFSIKKQYKWVL